MHAVLALAAEERQPLAVKALHDLGRRPRLSSDSSRSTIAARRVGQRHLARVHGMATSCMRSRSTRLAAVTRLSASKVRTPAGMLSSVRSVRSCSAGEALGVRESLVSERRLAGERDDERAEASSRPPPRRRLLRVGASGCLSRRARPTSRSEWPETRCRDRRSSTGMNAASASASPSPSARASSGGESTGCPGRHPQPGDHRLKTRGRRPRPGRRTAAASPASLDGVGRPWGPRKSTFRARVCREHAQPRQEALGVDQRGDRADVDRSRATVA